MNHNNHTRWDKFTISFVAQSPSTLVKLTTTDNATNHAVEIDDVRLTWCPSPCFRPPQDLVLWLPFDEANGLTAYNAVGASYNGRLFNGSFSDGVEPARLSAGYVNRALDFDGLNDWVCVGDYEALNVGTNDFSFDAWVRLAPGSTNGGNRLIAGKFREGGTGLRFGTDEGYLFFQYNGPLAIHSGGDTQRVPSDGQWHLVALTVRRGLFNGGQFYIDGVPTGSFDTRALAGELSTPGPLGVGGLLGREAWAGAIDEFEFFRRSLSAGEIQALYAAGAAGKCRIDASLRWDTSICPGGTFADVPATIYNYGAEPRTFTYQLQPGLCLNGTGPFPLTFSPASGTVTVPARGGFEFVVRVTMPAGTPCEQWRCFEMVVREAGNIVTISPPAQIQIACRACPIVSQARVILTNLLRQTLPPIRLSNPGNTPLLITSARFRVVGPDMLPDTRVISLNGLPPGVPWLMPTGALLAANAMLELPLDAAFTSFQPGQRFTVLVEVETDNSGLRVMASFDLVNEFSRPGPMTVRITRGLNGSITLNWAEDNAVLESAATALGPWQDFPSGVTNAVLPPPFPPAAPAKFFRLWR